MTDFIIACEDNDVPDYEKIIESCGAHNVLDDEYVEVAIADMVDIFVVYRDHNRPIEEAIEVMKQYAMDIVTRGEYFGHPVSAYSYGTKIDGVLPDFLNDAT